MSKITFIFALLFSFSALAKSPVDGIPPEKLKKDFFNAYEKSPDSEKIFIRKNTVSCGTVANAKRMRGFLIAQSNQIDRQDIRNLSCHLVEGQALGIVIASEGGYYFLVHTFPFSPGEIATGWFDGGTILTVAQRKKLTGAN